MTKTMKVLNIIGYLIMIAVNAASAYGVFGGTDVASVSDKYPTLLTPEGFTFLIWIVIYFALFLFTIFQATKGADNAVGITGVLFFFSCILNALWIVSWTFEQIGVSLIIMIVLLITLLVMYLKLNKDKYSASILFVKIPFSIYLAWICVATAANFSVFLKSIGWNMFNVQEEVWLVVVLAVILILTSYFIIKKKDSVFSIVILWAVFGILMRHLVELDRAYPYAVGFMIFMIIILIIENIYNLYRAMSR